MVCVDYFCCVYIIIVNCHTSIGTITLLNMLPLIFFSLNVENEGECCKAQWVCVHQRTTLHESYLLLLLTYCSFWASLNPELLTLWCWPCRMKCRRTRMGTLEGGHMWKSQRWMVYSQNVHSTRPMMTRGKMNAGVTVTSGEESQCRSVC